VSSDDKGGIQIVFILNAPIVESRRVIHLVSKVTDRILNLGNEDTSGCEEVSGCPVKSFRKQILSIWWDEGLFDTIGSKSLVLQSVLD